MEKEDAIKLLVDVVKSVQPSLRATLEEHEKIKQAIELLEVK